MFINDVTLRATVSDHRKGPHESFLQVAFAGRSNVGKSSLLNTLFGTRLAAVSKSPGKTRTINYYLVNRGVFFVDLPGYGYAKVSQSLRKIWGENISRYLSEEDRLKLVVCLIDPRIPTSPLDVELVNYVHSLGKPMCVVLTKTDQMKRGELAQAAFRLEKDLTLNAPPIKFSINKAVGKKELLAAISQVLTGVSRLEQELRHG